MLVQDIKIESDDPVYIETLIISPECFEEKFAAADIHVGRITPDRVNSDTNIELRTIGDLIAISNISISKQWGLYISFPCSIEVDEKESIDFRITSNDCDGQIVPKGISWIKR